MGRIKFSIIVPIFNSANTIELCVGSIQSQKEKDWELILADNGSTDNSVDVIKHLSASDNRIKAITVTQRGVSAARNAALDIATGDYVCFIDSDDTVDPDYLSTLSSNIDVDLSVCGYRLDYIDKNGNVSHSDSRIPESLIWNKPEPNTILTNVFENGYMHFCWNKLFHRSIIESRHIRFKPYPINEDYIFVLEYLKYVKGVSIIDRVLYHWRRPSGKATGVDSILDNLLSIYNKSHLLTRDFFQNNVIADRIAYFSYDLIMVYKYYGAYDKGRIPKDVLYIKLEKFVNNKLVNDAYRAYHPVTIVEFLLYWLVRLKQYRLHHFIYTKILGIKS